MTDANQIVPVPSAEYDALRRDAERYRYLRRGELYVGPRAVRFSFADGSWIPCQAEVLDTFTDAAIQSENADIDRMAAGFGEALALTKEATRK